MKYVPPILSLPRVWKREAERISELLFNHAHGDIDLWCDLLGLHLKRDDFVVRKPFGAFLYGDTIYLRERLMRNEEILCIAHEYCHYKFHPECVGFLDLNAFTSGKLEGQAIEFAKCVIE